MPKGLKLIAADSEELEILSAALEGLITSPGELSFSRTKRVFTLIGSRFMWEQDGNSAKNGQIGFRIRSGTLFSDVMNVKTYGISQDFPTETLELLNVSSVEKEDASAEIHLTFAGGGKIRLDVECVNVTLTDTGEAWPAGHKPLHEGTRPQT